MVTRWKGLVPVMAVSGFSSCFEMDSNGGRSSVMLVFKGGFIRWCRVAFEWWNGGRVVVLSCYVCACNLKR